MPIQLAHAQFMLGAHLKRQWPEDTGNEVAFAGRSNVGKSSAINKIAGRKALARTSKTPGRTQQINFFSIDDQHRLVDLPGYGFAKVPEAMQKHWKKSIEQYLSERRSLKLLVLLMDARRPFTPLDIQMLEWCEHVQLPVIILLTKADKLSRNQSTQCLRDVEKRLSVNQAVEAQLFSATKGAGVEWAKQKIIESLMKNT